MALLLRARLRGGVLSKARRGELIQRLPVGLVYDPSGRVVLDPDGGVQQAVRHLFATFERTGSAFAVVKAFTTQQLSFPRRLAAGPNKGELVWGPLQHSRVLQVLHNPRYAGAFFYGRHTHRIGPHGKPTIHLLPRQQWTVLITDAHPGYLSFAEFEANQARLAELAAARGSDRRASPPREGPALLQGLLVCGVCGTRMTVRYHTRAGGQVPEYVCQADGIRHGRPICQRIPGASLDATVGTLLVDTLTPWPSRPRSASPTSSSPAPTRPTGSAPPPSSAPATRLTWPAAAIWRSTLKTGWWPTPWRPTGTPRCANSPTPPTPTQHATQATTGQLTAAQRQRITQLASDFPALWNDPATPQRERKRLVRLLISDVTLLRTDQITAHVRLRGGQHHSLHLPIPLAAWQLRQTPPEVVSAIDELLDDHTDAQTATILSSRGLTSGTGQPLHARLIGQIRTHYQLPSHPSDSATPACSPSPRSPAAWPSTQHRQEVAQPRPAHRPPGQRQRRTPLPAPRTRPGPPHTGRPPHRPSPTTTTETTAASTTGGAV